MCSLSIHLPIHPSNYRFISSSVIHLNLLSARVRVHTSAEVLEHSPMRPFVYPLPPEVVGSHGSQPMREVRAPDNNCALEARHPFFLGALPQGTSRASQCRNPLGRATAVQCYSVDSVSVAASSWYMTCCVFLASQTQEHFLHSLQWLCSLQLFHVPPETTPTYNPPGGSTFSLVGRQGNVGS